MKLWVVILSILLFAFIGWQLWYVFLVDIEEPAYTVFQKKNGYELRQYKPYLIAQVSLPGSYRAVTNEGFKVLANYIFGGNKEDVSMPMTAPVLVEKNKKVGGYTIAFVMPASYTKETLPEPNDTRIQIKEKPSQKVAAYRFSWYATEKRAEQKKKLLASLLERDGIKQDSPIMVARYNPPFILPFLMRNELLVVIDD